MRTQGVPGSGEHLQDQRMSRSDNNPRYTRVPRPPPEEIFENLQVYFPDHDVDSLRPVIQAALGGTPRIPGELSPNEAEREHFMMRVTTSYLDE